MARLHEHQGKAILSAAGIRVPRGRAVRTPAEAVAAARDIGLPVMVKVQAWTTGRAAAGGISKALTLDQVSELTTRMLGMSFGKFPVTDILIEECLPIAKEFFLSLAIDERSRAPVLLFSAGGGSGVEDRASQAKRLSCHVEHGPDSQTLAQVTHELAGSEAGAAGLQQVARAVFGLARKVDARSLEINPLAVTTAGDLVALDCRLTIDDYAVARHPELGIEIARELDHPPTPLERVAYRIEQEDHRGTFFFAQMNTQAAAQSAGLIGFHGAGGGGSMMSMDAATAEGFTIANFCDTSGNPSPAKVYRAARIILSQPGLMGYFGSGSGVANQEQYWSAYGLAKAFWELDLSIPAVIRLGGNTEDRAVEILQSACAGLSGRVEGYRKNDTPARIAARFTELVREYRQSAGMSAGWTPRVPRRPAFVGAPTSHRFEIRAGRVWIDPDGWKQRGTAIAARCPGLFTDQDGKPALTLPPAEFAAKDSELIACEIECRRDGINGFFVELDLPDLPSAVRGEGGGR